jgi:hypothetical protein
LALKMVSPLATSPAAATVEDEPDEAAAAGSVLAAADASVLAPAAGAADALEAADVSVELDDVVSAGFEHPAITMPPIAATATSVKNLECIDAPFVSPRAGIPRILMIASDPAVSQGDAPSDEKQPDVSRISIRFAKPYVQRVS